MAFAFGQVANAQVVTFAQFLQKTGNQDYVFNNNTTNGSLTTVAGGSAIDFRYQNISNLPAELGGFQDAHLFVTTTTTTPSAMNGGQRNQPLYNSDLGVMVRQKYRPTGNFACLKNTTDKDDNKDVDVVTSAKYDHSDATALTGKIEIKNYHLKF